MQQVRSEDDKGSLFGTVTGWANTPPIENVSVIRSVIRIRRPCMKAIHFLAFECCEVKLEVQMKSKLSIR